MRKIMRKIMFAAIAASFAAPAFAGGLSMTDRLGKTMEEVKASLEKKGYEVRKAEMEDGKIEVYIVGDKEMGEVYVDPQTGKPVRIKIR